MTLSARIATDVGAVELVVTFVVSLLFVLTYACTARWWETRVGRNVMGLMAAIAAVTGLGVLHSVYPGGDVFLWVRVTVFFAVPVFLLRQLWLLIVTQVARRPATHNPRYVEEERAS